MATQEKAMVFAGEDTNYFRFASVKAQLRMESKGLKSSGGALRPRLAAEFGLKPRDPYEKFIAYCQAKMDAMLEAKAKKMAEGGTPAA